MDNNEIVAQIAKNISTMTSRYEYTFGEDTTSAREKYAESIVDILKHYAEKLGFDSSQISVDVTYTEGGKTNISINGDSEFIHYLNTHIGGNIHES